MPRTVKEKDSEDVDQHIHYRKGVQKQNILAKRLPEIRDIPYAMKLSIFGQGSLMGEEDVFGRGKFSCTIKCHTQKGKVFEISEEHFRSMKKSEAAWLAIMEKIIQKESRQIATHIRNEPRNFDKEDKALSKILKANLKRDLDFDTRFKKASPSPKRSPIRSQRSPSSSPGRSDGKYNRTETSPSPKPRIS